MNLKDKHINKKHQEDLGFEIPEDYFLKSKNEILSKVLVKKESKIKTLFKSKIVWFAAASIALIFTLSIYNNQNKWDILKIPAIVSDTLNSNKNLKVEANYYFEDDLLITSLFIEDVNVDTYIANSFIEEIVLDERIDDYILEQLMADELF
jgi:hypothetical protein